MRALAFLAALGIAASLLRGAAADADGPYSVWIAPELGIGSPADAARKLAEPFWSKTVPRGRESTEAIPFVLYDPDDGHITDQRSVANCYEYMDARRNGFLIAQTAWRNHPAYPLLSGCQVLGYLNQARPAEMSYVRNFSLDQHALSRLPPFFQSFKCTEDAPELYDAYERGQSWADYADFRIEPFAYEHLLGEPARNATKVFFDRRAKESLFRPVGHAETDFFPGRRVLHELYDLGYVYAIRKELFGYCRAEAQNASAYFLPVVDHLRILHALAMADFDGNGVEDVMIRQDVGGQFRPCRFRDVYLLTRSEPTGILRDVQEDRLRRCAQSW